MNPYQFFLKHAGYSYDPKTETPIQGRIKRARALAQAEREGRDKGLTFNWRVNHEYTSAEWVEAGKNGAKGRKPWSTWDCIVYDLNGGQVDSLHGMDFGRDGTPWGDPYKRVVEAELALENIDNERSI